MRKGKRENGEHEVEREDKRGRQEEGKRKETKIRKIGLCRFHARIFHKSNFFLSTLALRIRMSLETICMKTSVHQNS
jgi:hypothetical protein